MQNFIGGGLNPINKHQPINALTARLQKISVGDMIVISQRDWDDLRQLIKALDFLLPQPVTEYMAYHKGLEEYYCVYELCPKCGMPLERTYQAHCDNCGQRLRWVSKRMMTWKK